MVSIEVDEKTANEIKVAATIAGLSVAEYVRSLVVTSETISPKATWESIEKHFLELSVDGFLPDDFSNGDMYSDRD